MRYSLIETYSDDKQKKLSSSWVMRSNNCFYSEVVSFLFQACSIEHVAVHFTIP